MKPLHSKPPKPTLTREQAAFDLGVFMMDALFPELVREYRKRKEKSAPEKTTK